MEHKTERFKQLFYYLKDNGLIKSQKDFATRVNASEQQICHALKGHPKHLTDMLLTRVCNQYAYFSLDWLVHGNGSMIKEYEQPVTTAKADRFVRSEKSNVGGFLIQYYTMEDKLKGIYEKICIEIDRREVNGECAEPLSEIKEEMLDLIAEL